MTDVDAAFVQHILDIPQRQRVSNIQHHGQADDVRRRLDLPERAAPGHPKTLGDCLSPLRKSSSERAIHTLSGVRKPPKSGLRLPPKHLRTLGVVAKVAGPFTLVIPCCDLAFAPRRHPDLARARDDRGIDHCTIKGENGTPACLQSCQYAVSPIHF